MVIDQGFGWVEISCIDMCIDKCMQLGIRVLVHMVRYDPHIASRQTRQCKAKEKRGLITVS